MRGSRRAPILDFDQIPVDWGDMRFLVRATAAAMRNHEALEDEDVPAGREALARRRSSSRAREELVRKRSARHRGSGGDRRASTACCSSRCVRS